jgi:hypothetical protein
MFSTNKAKQLEKNDVDFLEAGIHENVKFTGVRIGQGNRNNAFIEFSFEKDGKRFTHTEWEPIKGALSNEAFEKKQTNITARAVEIMRCFYDDAMLNFEGETFSEFIQWVKTLLDNADTSKLVRLKVVYNDNGYTSLPSYTRFTWIESMSVAKEHSKIKELGIDKFTRPEIRPEMESKRDSFSNPVFTQQDSPVNTSQDLPF